MTGKRTELLRIVQGHEYLYTRTSPTGRKGHRYRVEGFATYVPAYQQVVVVRCLSGPDEGMWIVCSEANFASRYEPVPAEIVEPPVVIVEVTEDKPAGHISTGSGA